MTTVGKVVYALVLVGFAALALLALQLGTLFVAVATVVLGALFALTAPFVLGRRWRTPPPPPAYPTRRPVRRRR